MENFKVKEILEDELVILKKELEEKDLQRNYMICSTIDLRLRYGPLQRTKLKIYNAEDSLYKSFVIGTPVTSEENLQTMLATWDPNEIEDEAVGLLFSNIPNWNWNDKFLIFSSTWKAKLKFDDLFAKNHITANSIPLTVEQPGHHGIRFTIEENNIIVPELPPQYELGPLPASAAALMLSQWGYNFGESVEGLAERIELYKGVAVFYKSDEDGCTSKTVVAWTCQYMCGAIGITFTLPEHRRRGLGAAVTLSLAKQIVEEGRTPFLMVEKGNTRSMEFHKKLGFKVCGDTGCSFYAAPTLDR